jgi:D-alanyl-D-alanine carboxypeptidase
MRRHVREHLDPFFVYGLSVFLVVLLSISKLDVLQSFLLGGKSIGTHLSSPKSKNESLPLFVQSSFNTKELDSVHVNAKAYIIYDIATNSIIASKNATTELPLASLTKVMTAYTALKHRSREQSVVISPQSIDGGYDIGLQKGQVWKLDELLKYTLIFSSNDGAQAVAIALGTSTPFTSQMNADAQDLGLNLRFTNPAGLDTNGNIGGIGTALDVAKLFVHAHKLFPDILDATTKKRQTVYSLNGKISGVPNTNQGIEMIPGAEASKTGYTDLAGGNLGVIVDIGLGRPVVIVVLGSTREGRFKDVETLYYTLRKSFNVDNFGE